MVIGPIVLMLLVAYKQSVANEVANAEHVAYGVYMRREI